ncbi:hypothetical protein CC2G_008254 [Coprinopsis cinerea AmutBmut pab1-1]|nr:hypothetical protein CC2G_008254 [Coprinopsis cinerea AmutBmut pab1-1]
MSDFFMDVDAVKLAIRPYSDEEKMKMLMGQGPAAPVRSSRVGVAVPIPGAPNVEVKAPEPRGRRRRLRLSQLAESTLTRRTNRLLPLHRLHNLFELSYTLWTSMVWKRRVRGTRESDSDSDNDSDSDDSEGEDADAAPTPRMTKWTLIKTRRCTLANYNSFYSFLHSHKVETCVSEVLRELPSLNF